MSIVIRKYIPLALVAVLGFFMIYSYPIDNPVLSDISNELGSWIVVLSAFTMMIGGINMIFVNYRRVARKEKGLVGPSISLIGSLVVVTLLGLTAGVQSDAYKVVYDVIIATGSLTVASLLCFFQYSGFYRGFRARSFSGGLMLIGALLIFVWIVPIAEQIFPQLNVLTQWLLDNPFVGSNRGLTIIGGIAMIMMALRVITSADKSWMGEK